MNDRESTFHRCCEQMEHVTDNELTSQLRHSLGLRPEAAVTPQRPSRPLPATRWPEEGS